MVGNLFLRVLTLSIALNASQLMQKWAVEALVKQPKWWRFHTAVKLGYGEFQKMALGLILVSKNATSICEGT